MIADSEQEPTQEHVPMTRIVSFSMHEPMFEPLRKAAEDECEGSVSEWIRLRLYSALLNKDYISVQDIRRLG